MPRVELDPVRDRHALAALEAYADACAGEMPWLAEWLRDMLGPPASGPTRCAPTVLRGFELAQVWASGQPDYACAAWEHVRAQLHAALIAHADGTAGDPSADSADPALRDNH